MTIAPAIEFVVPGVPIPKGRARMRVVMQYSVAKRGKVPVPQLYTPKETVDAEAAFLKAAAALARPRKPLTGPLRVDFVFVLPRPQKLPSDRSATWPSVRPDFDNYVKLACDALNKVFWLDDGQICASSTLKIYGSPARTEVRISQLAEDETSQHALWEGINV